MAAHHANWWTQQRDDILRQMWSAGASGQEMADALGIVQVPAVWERRRALRPPPVKVGGRKHVRDLHLLDISCHQYRRPFLAD
jgi:hypothetical protein